MYKKVSLKGISDELFQSHYHLSSYWELNPNIPVTNIPLSEIENVIINAWGVNYEKLFGKINHADELDKAVKTSFCFAAYFYSNKSREQIAELMGCTQKYISRSVIHFFYKVKCGRKGLQRQHVQILEDLNRLAPKRMMELLSLVDFIDKTRPIPKIGIDRISLKEQYWFQSGKDIECYHPKFKEGYRIKIGESWNGEWYYSLQTAGYRFEALIGIRTMTTSLETINRNLDANGLQTIQKICSHCEYNAECPFKTEDYEGYETAQRLGIIQACPILRDSRTWIKAQILPDFKDPNLWGYYGVTVDEVKRELCFIRNQN